MSPDGSGTNMTNRKTTRKNNGITEVRKPFMTGTPCDERTVRNSLAFFGTMLIIFLVAFIACVSASFDSIILRIGVNTAVILLVLLILYNNGARRGADDVAKGEIIWQKKENGKPFSEGQRKICFHPLKGFLIGLIGSIPLLIPAIYLAVNTTVQTTDAGTLPSWMQAYLGRSDIGNALISYTQPEGMKLIDFIRAIVRVMIMPFVNLAGPSNSSGILLVERLSPLILLLPAAAYGTGYLSGKKARTRIHTMISENNRKRIRREKKKTARNTSARNREPEQLN